MMGKVQKRGFIKLLRYSHWFNFSTLGKEFFKYWRYESHI